MMPVREIKSSPWRVLFSLSLIGALHSGAVMGAVGVNTLKGIERIAVVIDDLTSESTNAGLTEEALRNRMESALKRIKLNVVASSNQAESSRLFVPILYLSVETTKAGGFHDFLVHLELLQAVTLARDPAIKASSATTWSALRFARVEESEYANKVRT